MIAIGTIQSLYISSDMSLLSQLISVLLFQRTFNAQSWYESFYTGINLRKLNNNKLWSILIYFKV